VRIAYVIISTTRVAYATGIPGGWPSQSLGAHRFYRCAARHGAVRNSGGEHARFLRAARLLRPYQGTVPRPRGRAGPNLHRRFYPREVYFHFFVSLRDGFCHPDEPGGSARRALHGFLSTTPPGARTVRTDPWNADLGGRHPADLCVLWRHLATLPQTPTEDLAVVGRKFVRAAHRCQLGLPGPVLQPFPPSLDGSQAAGHAKTLHGHQHLRAWNGAADPGAELGGMEAGVAHHAICDLCDGAISAGHVGVASGHRTAA